MKKKEAFRNFTFSDAVLVTKGKEKVAFMRRDAIEFEAFGITTAALNGLEANLDAFAENITDVEALSDQTEITALKERKAEELRIAIRAIMTRAELKFGLESAKYRKFGSEALARQSDAELLITSKRVVRVATLYLAELTEKGLTPEMLSVVTTLGNQFENLLIDMKIKIGERDILQEARVEFANAIYTTLAQYAHTGQKIWSDRNVAKYNDYILYNTPTGEAPPTETPAA